MNLNESAGATSNLTETRDQEHSILKAGPEGSPLEGTDPKQTSRESDNPETRIPVGQVSGSQHPILKAAPEGASLDGADPKQTSWESDNPETRIPVGQASGSQHPILKATPEGASLEGTDPKQTSRESDNPETRIPVGQASGNQTSILNPAPEGASLEGTDPKQTSRESDNPETRIPVGQASGNQTSILNPAPEGALLKWTDPKQTSRQSDNPETRTPVGQASGNQTSILKAGPEGSALKGTDPKQTSRESDNPETRTPVGQASGNQTSILKAGPEGSALRGTDPKQTSRESDNTNHSPTDRPSGKEPSTLKTVSEGVSNRTSSLVEKTGQVSSWALTSRQDGTGEPTPTGRPSGNGYPHPETEGDSKALETSHPVRVSGKNPGESSANPDVNLNLAGRTPAATAEAPTDESGSTPIRETLERRQETPSGVASSRTQGGAVADPTSEKTLSVGTIRRDEAPVRPELVGGQSPTQIRAEGTAHHPEGRTESPPINRGNGFGESTGDPVLGTAGVESQFGRSSVNRIHTPLPPPPTESGKPEVSASSANPDQPIPKNTQGTGGQPGPIEEGLETSRSKQAP